MEQVTVIYMVDKCTMTDIIVGEIKASQILGKRGRVRLRQPGKVFIDAAEKSVPVTLILYSDVKSMYRGPAEPKYLDVA